MFSATCSVFGVGGLNATAWATVDRPRAEQLVTHQASKKPIQRNNWKIRGLYVRSVWLMSSGYVWFLSLVSENLLLFHFIALCYCIFPFLCHIKAVSVFGGVGSQWSILFTWLLSGRLYKYCHFGWRLSFQLLSIVLFSLLVLYQAFCGHGSSHSWGSFRLECALPWIEGT